MGLFFVNILCTIPVLFMASSGGVHGSGIKMSCLYS